MMIRRIGAHTTDYVRADGRRLVAGSPTLQLINDFLWSEGLTTCSSPDGWKDGEDLITSGHKESLSELASFGQPAHAAYVLYRRAGSCSAVVGLPTGLALIGIDVDLEG